MDTRLTTVLRIVAGLGSLALMVPLSGCVPTAAVAEPMQAPLPPVDWPNMPIAQLEFSRDGKSLLLSRVVNRAERSQSRIEIWDVKRRAIRQSWEQTGLVDSLVLSDDAQEVALSVSWGGKELPLQIWSTVSGRRIRAIDNPSAGRIALALEPRRVLMGGSKNLTWVDTDTGGVLGRQPFPPLLLSDMKASPDARYLAASQEDVPVSTGIWDIKTGRYLGGFGPEDGTRAGWSPDGSLLAANSETATTVVDIATQQVVHQFPAAGSDMMPTISADNRWLVNGGTGTEPDEATTLWSLKTGKRIGPLNLKMPVQFSPAVNLIVGADMKGTQPRFLPLKEVLHTKS